MECPQCSKSYQDGVCEPYILIGCGHSICFDCLKEQSLKNEDLSEQTDESSVQAQKKFSIICPECESSTQAESLNQFPKNFSLLNMIKSSLTSRTAQQEDKEEVAIRDINNMNQKSMISQASTHPQRATAEDHNYQSVSDYHSTLNYDKHNRDDFLDNLDIHEQVSHSQGGQGDQSGTRDYKRKEMSKLDQHPIEQSAARSLNLRDFDNDALSVKLNANDEKKLLLSQQSSSVETIQNQLKKQDSKTNKISDEIEPNSEVSRSIKEEQQSQYSCQEHGKGIQGYCQNCRQVLCIDCILSGVHKNHEICSTDNAAKTERDALTLKFQKTQVIQDLINTSLVKAKNHQDSLKNQAQQYKNQIQQIYSEVRALIEEKEKSLIADVESKLQKEIKYLGNREKDAQNQLNVIEQFQTSWNKLGDLSDEQLLMDINNSHKEAEKALVEPKAIKTNQVITKVNKDTEIAQLTKFILNSANQVNLPMSSVITQPVTSSHTQISTTPEVQSAKMKEIEKEQQATQVAEQQLKQHQKRFNQRRDSGFKAPNLQKQATQTQRSSSTRPNGFNQIYDPHGNNNNIPGATSLQKASYMQATSSWAKRKQENDKHKEEFNTKKINDRNRYQNPKGFTTLVGSANHAMSTQGDQQQSKNHNNREMHSSNIMRNSRLTSKDRKITNPFERHQNNVVAEKQQNPQVPLGQMNANGAYNSAHKLTGSPTNAAPSTQDYNPSLLKTAANKQNKPESAEKKKKGKPAPMPQMTNQAMSVSKKDSKHTINFSNMQSQKSGINANAESNLANTNLISTQSQNNLNSTGTTFQTMNSRGLLNNSSINKTEKLHFLKSKQRMPILKESRANNNSRLGIESSDKDNHGNNVSGNMNKTYAQNTQRNRSQTRLDDKNTDIVSDKQNSGSATVPTVSNLGRKKQTWQRSNTNNNIYNFDQGLDQNKGTGLKKKQQAPNNQSIDGEIGISPTQTNVPQQSKNSFQKAALEKKRQAETSLRNSQEGKFNSHLIPESTSDDAKFLLNLSGANKAVPQMSSLLDKRNELKNRNLKTIDVLPEMRANEGSADAFSQNMDSEIKHLQDLLKQQAELNSVGFNDTQYARQIHQISQTISLDSQIDAMKKQLDSQRLQHQQDQLNSDRPSFNPQLNTGTFMNFNSSMQVNMGAVQANAFDEPVNNQTSAAVAAAEQQQFYRNNNIEAEENQQQQHRNNNNGDEKHDDYQMMQQINAKTDESFKDSAGQRGPNSPRSGKLVKEDDQLANSSHEPKTEHKSVIGDGYQLATQEDQNNMPKQQRQRWSTIKKHNKNEETSGEPRGQSLSQVFIDDSQDNGHMNDLVPHNDTQYCLAEDSIAIHLSKQGSSGLNKTNQLQNQNSHYLPQQQQHRQSPLRGQPTDNMLAELDLPKQPPVESSAFSSSIDHPNNYSQYTEPNSARPLDFYPQIQSYALDKYDQLSSNRKPQPDRDAILAQPQNADLMRQQQQQYAWPLQKNNLIDGQQQMPPTNDKRPMVGMSFAPPSNSLGGHEDYQSETKQQNNALAGGGANMTGAGIQMPQTFMSKYQAQLLDSQKQNSGIKKRGEIDDSCLHPEATIGDQPTLDMQIAQSQPGEQEGKSMFSIFAISGYCDQPLSAVERITFKFNQPSMSPLKPKGTFSERVNSNFRLEDEESVVFPAMSGSGWQQCAQLNVARTKFEAVIVPENRQAGRIKQQIWILGGKNSQSQRIDVIEMYDEGTDAWNIIPQIKMRKAKSGFASVLAHNEYKDVDQLMVIGGNDGQVQNRVEFMNLWDYQWHKCASMISRRDELAACLGPDGKIYAIGGYGGPTNSSCLRSVERYDIQKNKWEQVASMNEGRRALAAVSMPDGIYAIGGYNGKDYISSVEKYDVENDQWQIVCHLNSPKCTMTAVASPDEQKFFVIGGFNGTQLNEVEVYNTQTRTLRKFSYPMELKRFMHSSAVLVHQ